MDVLAIEENTALLVEVLAVFAFACSGALAALRTRLDWFGCLVLAWITGLGGGILRDVFLGDLPPVGISDWRLLLSAVAGGVVVVVASYLAPIAEPRRTRRRSALFATYRLVDAAGLALYCVIGAVKALMLEAGPTAAVVVGGITAIGGGMIRDVLVGQVPVVLHRDLYAVPALLGAGLVVLAAALDSLNAFTLWGVVLLVLVIRLGAIWLDMRGSAPWGGNDEETGGAGQTAATT